MVTIDAATPTGTQRPGEGFRAEAPAARPEGPTGFRVGQTVQVELVKDLGGGAGLLKIAGRYFRALAPPGLPTGTPMTLKVADAGPPLLLELPDAWSRLFARLVHPSGQGFPAAAAALAEAGGKSAEMESLLARLADLLSLPQDPAALAQALGRYLRLSGLFHEADLAAGTPREDAKTLILRLLALAKEAGDEGVEKLLSSLLSHIEAHQARSLLEGSRFLPLYLPWWGKDDPAQGEIELDPHGRAGEKALSGQLTLRLDLPHLGGVEAALYWSPAGIAVNLKVQPQLEAWMDERVEALRAALDAAPGVRLAGLSVEALVPAPPATTRGLLELTA